jgi:hypothetical protein
MNLTEINVNSLGKGDVHDQDYGDANVMHTTEDFQNK